MKEKNQGQINNVVNKNKEWTVQKHLGRELWDSKNGRDNERRTGIKKAEIVWEMISHVP